MMAVAVVAMGIITLAVLALYWRMQCDVLSLLRDMAGVERKPKEPRTKSRIIHPYKLKREGGEDV